MKVKMWMSYISDCNVCILLTTISSINLFNNNTKMKTIYSVFYESKKVNSYIGDCNVCTLYIKINSINLFNNNAEIETINSVF